MFTFPRKTKHERLSVSIPSDLVTWIRETAKTHEVNISDVVAYAVRHMKAEPIKQEIMRGLMEDYEDSLKEEEQ